MKRYQAEEELAKIVKPVNANAGRIDETTFGGFMDARWKPLHESDWREESTRGTNEQLMTIIRNRFGATPLLKIDKVELQSWLNELAKKYSKSIIMHVRTFLKSICSEAVEQDYLIKDPSRHLKRPKNTKSTDTTVLTWEDLRRIFAALGERDRLIISIEGIAGLRPSELFALRRKSFTGDQLRIAETIYRGKIRHYGKTDGSLTTVDLSPALAKELKGWLENQEGGPESFIFPNSDGGFISKDNYLNRVLYPLRDREGAGIQGITKLNFQVLRRTFSTLAQAHGTVKDVQRQMRHAKPDMTAGTYMQPIPESVREMVFGMYEELLKPVTVQ
jgi:integrase